VYLLLGRKGAFRRINIEGAEPIGSVSEPGEHISTMRNPGSAPARAFRDPARTGPVKMHPGTFCRELPERTRRVDRTPSGCDDSKRNAGEIALCRQNLPDPRLDPDAESCRYHHRGHAIHIRLAGRPIRRYSKNIPVCIRAQDTNRVIPCLLECYSTACVPRRVIFNSGAECPRIPIRHSPGVE
jgi:hypothetical protein